MTSSQKSARPRSISRRLLLAGGGAAGAALVAAPAIIGTARGQSRQKIVYVAYGGATQDAQIKAIIQVFEKETGIQVINASGPDVAKLKAQVMTGNIEWDVVNTIGSQAASAALEGLFEPLDYSIIDASDVLVEKKETIVPWYVYGGGIGFDPKRHPAGKHPRDWPQFWDVKAFPGRRGLRSRPDENIELALMADGVPAKKLYPCDVDRAFRSLDRIKPHVVKWIPETPQTVSLVQSNEVDFVFTYSGRVEAAIRQGVSMDYVYEANIVTPSYLGVPKGSKNKAAGMKLISYFMRPDLQAHFCNIMGYTPVKRAGRPLLAPDVLARQPDLDDEKTAVTDVEWWAKNFVEVNKRFKEWLIT